MVDYSASLEGGSVCDQKRMERAEPNPTEGSGSNRREEDAARGLESKPDELALPSVRPDDPQILPPRHSLASISAPSVSSTRSSAAELSVPSWRPSSSGGSELTTSSTLPKLEGGLPSGYQNTTDPPSGRESASAPVPQGTGANWEELEFEGQEAVQQAEGGGHIAVDSDDAATTSDAGYESDAASSASTSLLSAVRDYTFENGRRYHRFREGRYNFPNDDVEQEREDMKHAMVKMLCQTLHFAPIGDRPQQILDIGTGTGIWAIEMADQFPSATVLGIDLSPIQPEWVPPNVKFMVDDAESQWLHPRNHFDYIHSRHTVMAIKDWPRLLSQAFEHLRPGGWIELQEVHHMPVSTNNSMKPEHPVAQYWKLIHEGLGNLGVPLGIVARGGVREMLRQAGYVNVTERVFQIPIGTWPKNRILKTVGLYWRTILLDGIQAIALGPLTRGCGWTREMVEVFLVDVRKAYHDNSCLLYMPLYVTYARKPETETS